MPRVVYTNPLTGERRDKPFQTPKSITSHSSWVTQICKVLPNLPNPRHTQWVIASFEPTLTTIEIILEEPRSGLKHHLLVDRTASYL